MKSLLVPSTAKYIFNKIKKNLKNFGYDVEFASEVEGILGERNTYQQSFKIKGFNTTYGKVFTIQNNAPLLNIRLFSYDNGDAAGQQYNLRAWIPGTNYDWEGEDWNLQQVTDAYLEDADSDIANVFADNDYLDLSTENETVEQLNEGLIKNIDLDSLDKQVKENNDIDSLEELNAKVDTILDALGLIDDNDDDEKDAETDFTEETEVKHIEAADDNGDENV